MRLKKSRPRYGRRDAPCPPELRALDTRRASGAIGAWFDRTFPTAEEQGRYLPRFADEVRSHALQQRDGTSPDSCRDVAEAFYEMRW